MPDEHTDHSTFHARSPLRPLHLHLCQVSTRTRPLHRCQVSTQTIPTTSMPGQQRNIPPPSMPGTDTGQQPPQIPGQHTDYPTSILVSSPLRPPHLHPSQVGAQTTPATSMPGQHTDLTISIHARSTHRRPPHLHPARSVTDHHTTIPLTDKDKRLVEASSRERLTMGETGSCSDRRGHA